MPHCYASAQPCHELPSSSQQESQASGGSYEPGGSQEIPDQSPEKLPKKTDSQLQLDREQSALKEYVNAAGIKNFFYPRNWKALESSTKRKRVQKTRELIRRAIQTVSPDGAEDLTGEVLRSSDETAWLHGAHTAEVAALLTAISDAYKAAEARQQRLQLLSIVVSTFSLSVLRQYIPGLTQYMFSKARHHAAQFGPGTHMEPQQKGGRLRIPEKRIEIALDFIASDLVSIPSPFGTLQMKMSDGEKQEIDLYIRQQSSEHIFNLYQEYMEQTEQQSDALSRSLFLDILSRCPARTRRSVHGLDNYSYAGLEAIDSLIRAIGNWEKDGIATKEWSQQNIGALQDSKMYLRGDYRAHVMQLSNVADHCKQWALSDDKKGEFQQNDNHDHNLKCPRCETVKEVLSEVEAFVNNLAISSPTDHRKDEALFLIQKAMQNVFAWKQHQLRTVHQDTSRTDIWNNLKENEIFVIVDFAMKWLPEKGRESQQMWFGKFIAFIGKSGSFLCEGYIVLRRLW